MLQELLERCRRLFPPPSPLSLFRSFGTSAATAAVLELWNERLSLALLHEVYMYLGGEPKRKFCDSVEVGYCEIATVYDVHTDQDIGADQFAFGDADADDTNIVG
jgi:hypothetical protein